MHYHLLRRLEGPDALTQLFNQYLRGLHTPMLTSEPTYYTVADTHRHTRTAPTSDEAHCYQHCALRFYELTILRHSLEDLRDHVLAAIAALEGCFTTYGDDLLAYAQANRLATLAEYGSADEADWYRHDEADETEEWKVTPTADPVRLAPYTLRAELGRFIGGEECRGEYIGTSGPHDFATHSLLVAQQSEFSFRKLAEQVWGATLVQVEEDGTQAPIPLADHLEREMNQDIRAADVVARFNLVLGFCQVIRERYERLDPADLIGYQTLLACLQKVRDAEFPESLFDNLLARS